MGGRLFVEADILTKAEQINGIIVAFYQIEDVWFLAIWRRWLHKEVVEFGQLSGNMGESSRYFF